MRHNPTTEELEHAVAGVLQQTPDKELSAKEVREKLVKEKGEWKVPAERRIAKFVKRQNSRKASKGDDGSRNGLLGKFFKGSGSGKKSPPITTQEAHPRNNNNNNNEEDPSMSKSEKERKGGLRSSIAKVFSPNSSKNRKTAGGAPESVQTTNPKAVGGEDVSVVTMETAEGEKPAAVTASSPPLETETPTTQDDNKPEEVASGDGNADADVQTAVKDEEVGEVDHASKEVFTEAYVDDNDGKTKGDCACGACVMM